MEGGKKPQLFIGHNPEDREALATVRAAGLHIEIVPTARVEVRPTPQIAIGEETYSGLDRIKDFVMGTSSVDALLAAS